QTAQSGVSSPFGYDGMYRDIESGLYAMSGGAYDPATGQTLSRGDVKMTVVFTRPMARSVQWEPHKSPGLDSPELPFGDGIDDGCEGTDLCTLSPYAVGGGDPINGGNKAFIIPHVIETKGTRNDPF